MIKGPQTDLNSNALEIKIASGKVCLVSASNIAILKRRWTEIELFKQVGFHERFIFWTYKEEMNFCFVRVFTKWACIISL